MMRRSLLMLFVVCAASACSAKVPEPEPMASMEGVKAKVAHLQKKCMEKAKADPNQESLKFRCGMSALKQVEGNLK